MNWLFKLSEYYLFSVNFSANPVENYYGKHLMESIPSNMMCKALKTTIITENGRDNNIV